MPRKLAYHPRQHAAGNGSGGLPPTPKLCQVCGEPFTGLRRSYCSEDCAREGGRQQRREYYQRTRQLVSGKWKGCHEGGCVFFATCKANIMRPNWDPYCSPDARLHPLFLREYDKDLLEVDVLEPIKIRVDAMMEAT